MWMKGVYGPLLQPRLACAAVHMTRRSTTAVVWPLFVRAAILAALLPGFGLGAALFIERGWGDGFATWWPAAAQAHGHAQLFGWITLMVLGTALHFLPRLAGAPAVSVTWARVAFICLVTGLAVRVVVQPLVTLLDPSLYRALLPFSGLLELAGILAAAALLLRVCMVLAAEDRSVQVRVAAPFVFVVLLGLGFSSLANVAGLLKLAQDNSMLVPRQYAEASIVLGFHAFLVPVAVMMSLRLFPLYVQTRPSGPKVLLPALGALVAGLLLRIGGDALDVDYIEGVGRIVQSLGILVCVYGTGVFGAKRPLPRASRHPLSDPLRLLMMSAYVWLVVAAAILFIGGLNLLNDGTSLRIADLEYHALGAGFATLLIFGAGSHLFPGFMRQRLRSQYLAWLVLVLGTLAALLRVLPVLLADDPAGLPAVAGICGGLAVALFAINVGWVRVPDRKERA